MIIWADIYYAHVFSNLEFISSFFKSACVSFYFCLASIQNWKKFGNSEYDAPGPNVATTTVSDDVYMTFISSKEVRN